MRLIKRSVLAALTDDVAGMDRPELIRWLGEDVYPYVDSCAYQDLCGVLSKVSPTLLKTPGIQDEIAFCLGFNFIEEDCENGNRSEVVRSGSKQIGVYQRDRFRNLFGSGRQRLSSLWQFAFA